MSNFPTPHNAEHVKWVDTRRLGKKIFPFYLLLVLPLTVPVMYNPEKSGNETDSDYSCDDKDE